MILGDVLKRTDKMVKLEARHWAWARFLGEARTASNDARRAARSDRGKFNTQVDLVGALGELFLLRAARAAKRSEEAVAYMRDHLYREQGGKGVEGPDIRFVDHVTNETQELDVKTFDCMPNKSFFAINDNKHGMLRGQCSGYLCVITPRFGCRIAVARLVPYAEVEKWCVKRLRHGGSESRNLSIECFLEAYFTNPPVLKKLRKATFSEAKVHQAYEDPSVRAEFAELVPNVLVS